MKGLILCCRVLIFSVARLQVELLEVCTEFPISVELVSVCGN